MAESATRESDSQRGWHFVGGLPRGQPYLGLQRGLLAATLVIAAFVVNGAVVDQFSLPRAFAYVVVLIALLATSAIRAGRTGKVSVPRSPVLVVGALFAGALLSAVVMSDHPMRSVIGPYSRYSGLLMYGVYSALMAFVVRCYDRRSVALLGETATASLLAVAAYGLLQHAGLDPVDWPVPADAEFTLPQEFATFGNVNFASGFVGVLAPIALWRVATDGVLWKRAGGAAAFVFALAFVVLSESSQGVLATGAGSVLVLVVLGIEHRSTAGRWMEERRAAVAGTLVALLVGLALAVPRLAGYVSDELSDAGARERRQLWSTAVELWQERPLFGHGLGAFAWLFRPNRPVEHAVTNTFLDADAPHNVFLDMAVSGGVLLLLCYVAVVVLTGFVLVQGLRRLAGADRALLAGFGGAWVGYQVQSMVSIDVPPVALLHWILTGAVFVIAGRTQFHTVQVSAKARARNNRVARRRPGQAQKVDPLAVVGTAVACLVLLWLALVPVRADRASLLAMQARAAGDPTSMRSHAERAVDLAPWEAQYWAQLAAAADALGDLTAAQDAGERAAARSPGSSFYALALAGIAERQDDDEAVERWLREALRRDPHNPRVIEAVEEARAAR